MSLNTSPVFCTRLLWKQLTAARDTKARFADVAATSEAVRHRDPRCVVLSARLLPQNSANYAELKIALLIGAGIRPKWSLFSHVFLFLCPREEEEPWAEAGQRSLCTAHSCSNVSTAEKLLTTTNSALSSIVKQHFPHILFLIFT